eukprot:4627794-Amphidinium_carterae.1
MVLLAISSSEARPKGGVFSGTEFPQAAPIESVTQGTTRPISGSTLAVAPCPLQLGWLLRTSIMKLS